MNITEYLEKWGKALLETPLASRRDEPPEVAEIRLAVLDHVRESSYRSGGKKIFPFDQVRVRLRGVEESRREAFQGPFFRRYLDQEVRNGLRDAGCRFPENLRIDIEASATLPKPGEEWMIIESGCAEPAGAGQPVQARLLVREGSANATEIPLRKGRTNIGRVVDVYRSEGLFRRNDLAFAEDTEINRTVSREHAHIQYERLAGEFRLFNDRWYPRGKPAAGECGTWIVRDGMSQEVHRNARGTRLEPGDEIHFGRAVVIFEIEPLPC